MSALGHRLMSHLYGAVGLSVVARARLADGRFRRLSRHFGRVGWHTVTPLYTMLTVLLHRLIPLALVIGTALTIGFGRRIGI